MQAMPWALLYVIFFNIRINHKSNSLLVTTRHLFFQHLAPTSLSPLAIEIVKAKGVYFYDIAGKKYLDAISGINVSYVGHCNPFVVKKTYEQLKTYSHLMVYGELIQSPQVAYAKALTNNLPSSLQCVYFTNSGTEAVEAAMKLAKRITKKTNIIAFNHSYHGSTQGALSLLGSEYWRNAYRPLLPNIWHYDYNSQAAIDGINVNTACIIMESVQAEAGIILPHQSWLKAIAEKCKATNTLLIFDEIQTGFGRTGTLWNFEQHNIIPDVLLLGKALGGGLPLGAVVSSKENLQTFASNPLLGHITTFGGNAIACKAGLASFEYAIEKKIFATLNAKIKLFERLLQGLHSPFIQAKKSKGLWAAIEMPSPKQCIDITNQCIEKGLFIDWFLFASNNLRIAPPLTITPKELKELFTILQTCLSEFE